MEDKEIETVNIDDLDLTDFINFDDIIDDASIGDQDYEIVDSLETDDYGD